VAGSDQHLLAQVPISQYKHIRACIARRTIPQLMLMSKKKVYESLPEPTFHQPAYMRKALPQTKPPKEVLLWEYDTFFKINIVSATSVNLRESGNLLRFHLKWFGMATFTETFETNELHYCLGSFLSSVIMLA
jgi:hypothetical protein